MKKSIHFYDLYHINAKINCVILVTKMEKIMFFRSAFIGVIILLMTSACTPISPYAKGKSAADIPANIETINVLVTNGYGVDKNDNPKIDTTATPNDKEAAAVARKAVLNQIKSYGYRAIEDPKAKADVSLGLFLYYIPERWPLIGRVVSVSGVIYDEDRNVIFKTAVSDQNTAGLIGAVAGPSRDEMVSSVARTVTVTLVKELQKGTKNTAPVDVSGTASAPNEAMKTVAPLPDSVVNLTPEKPEKPTPTSR
jgi:hypothetical protein